MTAITVCGLEIPHEALDLEGFRNWVESLPEPMPRLHFSQGRIQIEMAAQDYDTHGPAARRIGEVLGPLADRKKLGLHFVAPSWFTHERAGLSTEPDGFLVLKESFASGKVRIHPRRRIEMVGAPDMTLEVVSKTTVKKDTVELVRDYARAGVREYWIVDLREEEVVFRILVLGENGEYADQPADLQGWVESPLWGESFRLVRYIHDVGLPDCRLEFR